MSNSKWQHIYIGILSLLCLCVFWQITAMYINAPLILPRPYSVLHKFIVLCRTDKFRSDLAATAERCFVSFCIASCTGFIVGFLSGLYFVCRQIFSPFLAIISSTPVVSIILLAMFWLSSSTIPIFAAVLMSFPVMVSSVTTGFSKTDNSLLSMAHSYHFSKFQIFHTIRFSGAVPFIFSGCISVFGLCWKVVAAGEVLSLPRYGAGTRLQNAQVALETDEVFAVTVSIICLCFLFEKLIPFCIQFFIRILKEEKRKIDTQRVFTMTFDYEIPHNTSICPDIKIQNLTLHRGQNILYRNFSLHAAGGKTLAILAPSGSGKTTLLDYISGLLKYDKGETGIVTFGGNGKSRIAYLFQSPCLIPNVSILQNVALPLYNCMPAEEALMRASFFLSKAGLGEKIFSLPHELSGGEKQRVSLVRAFSYPAPILFMDEAFQSQDPGTKLRLISLFKTMSTYEKKTVLFVTHDIREAVSIADRVIVLQGTPLQIKIDTDTSEFDHIKNMLSERGSHFIETFISPPAGLVCFESEIMKMLFSHSC